MIDIKEILPIIVEFITVTLAVMVLVSNRKDSRHVLLFSIILFSSLWITCGFIADHASSESIALFWTRIAIIPPAFVLPLFLLFSLRFPVTLKKYAWIEDTIIFIPATVYAALAFTPLNIISVNLKEWGTDYTPGILYKLFIPYFILYFSFTLYNFYKSFKKGDATAKAQIKFVCLGLLSAFTIGIITNVILPLFGMSQGSVFGPSLSILFLASFNTYAILKHHLFNIKVIAAEVITFAIWIFLLIQILVSDSTYSKIFNSGLLVLIIFFGILLMKSVIKEVQQRLRLQLLTEELEKANSKLKELDKLKSEFLGFATHQVRTPLTAIKGASSMLLEGAYGKLANDKQRSEISYILQWCHTLMQLIGDFLDVSKIEQGGMKYTMVPVDIKKMIEELVAEFHITAKNKGIALSMEVNNPGNYSVKADQVKIRQVFLNVIDNAIKYTPKGSVHVKLSKPDLDSILVSITDSGVGISSEDIKKLFEKFSRLESGNVSTSGSGIGLYLAKEIITAHGGKFRAESNGLNKGTKFTIELINIPAH